MAAEDKAGCSVWPPGEEAHTCWCTDRSKELHYSYEVTVFKHYLWRVGPFELLRMCLLDVCD